MKKKIKIIILILIIIIVYFVKIKNYRIGIDESEVDSIDYLIIHHIYNDRMEEIVELDSDEVDDETQKTIVDIINNSKYKLKKVSFTKKYKYTDDKIRPECYRVQSIIRTDEYRVEILIATDNRKYSKVCVIDGDKMFKCEYKFEKESFEELNNFIKDYMAEIEQS